MSEGDAQGGGDARLPAVPARSSLNDQQLSELLSQPVDEDSGTLGRIEQLEQQLTLRNEEAAQYRAWEAQLRQIGTSAAAEMLRRVEPDFADVISLPFLPEPAPGAAGRVHSQESKQSDADGNPSPDDSADADHVGDAGAMVTTGTEVPPSYESLLAQLAGAPTAEHDSAVSRAEQAREADETTEPSAPDATVQADLHTLSDEQPVVVPAPGAEAPVVVAEVDAAPAMAAGAPGFGLEHAGVVPTELDRRVGHSTRLFWLWFSVNSSVISIAAGAVLFGLGMNLRQTILATLAGLAVSFVPLSLGTLAGKWSGQPTMVVSRASFGLIGNIVPAALAVLTRVFMATLLLWLLVTSTMALFAAAGWTTILRSREIGVIALAVAFVAILIVSFLGFRVLALLQLIVSGGSLVLIIMLVALTWWRIDLAAATTAADGSWWLLLSGAAVVFSLVGLGWAQSSSDLARYQRPSTSGSAAMLSASFGATVAPFLLISYGALLAASDPGLAGGLVVDPVASIAALLPLWYPVPLLLALCLSLLAGSALALYSGGFALQNIGFSISRQGAVLPVALLVGLSTAALIFADIGFGTMILDLATAIAVPVAAWTGIFTGEMMLRLRQFDPHSLVRRGGSYPDVQWVNLAGLVVATVIGFGFAHGDVGWLQWQGYLLRLLEGVVPAELVTSDIGVFIALAVGLLTSLSLSLGPIRRQEGGRRMVVSALADES